MARPKKQNENRLILDNPWILLTLGLPTAVPAGILMPLAYGTDPFTIGVTAATCAFCMGGGYIARAIAHRIIAADYDYGPRKPPRERSRHRPNYAPHPHHPGGTTMARRQRKNKKLPIVDNHWILLGLGLWTGIPSAILIPMAYGTDAFGIGLAAGTFAACMGAGYLIRAIAHRLIATDYDDSPHKPLPPERSLHHPDYAPHPHHPGGTTMARRQRKNKKLPIVDNHWILLGIGLWPAVLAGILLPLAYGTSPFTIGVTAATCAFCLGAGYIIRAIAHRLIVADYDDIPRKSPPPERSRHRPNYAPHPYHHGGITMTRRQRKPQKLPIVDNHWILWFLGLWVGIPAIIMMPIAYGPSPFVFGMAIGTCAACVGGGYIIRIIAHRVL